MNAADKTIMHTLRSKIMNLYIGEKYAACTAVVDEYFEEYPDASESTLVFKALSLLFTDGDKDEIASTLRRVKKSTDDLREKFCARKRGLDDKMVDVIRHEYAQYFAASALLSEQRGNIVDCYYAAQGAITLRTVISNCFDSKLGNELIRLENKFARKPFAAALLALPYEERRLICMVDRLPIEKPNNIMPLLIKEASKHISFPLGHPVASELYIGHPLSPTNYFPVESYEDYLFQSQVMELHHILQCLGATKIVTKKSACSDSSSAEYKSSSRRRTSAVDLGVKARFAVHSGSAEINEAKGIERKSATSGQAQSTSDRSMSNEQTFCPTATPHLPEGLVWLEHNPTWKALVRQRLDGKLLRSDITISSRNIVAFSERQMKAVETAYNSMLKAEYENIVFGIGAEMRSEGSSARKDVHRLFRRSERTMEERIFVEFAPIEKLTGEPEQRALITGKL